MKRILFSLILIVPGAVFGFGARRTAATNPVVQPAVVESTVEEITRKALSQEKLSVLIAAFESQIAKNHSQKAIMEKDLALLKQMKGANTLSLIQLGNKLSDTVKNVLKGLYANLDYGSARQKAVALAAS